MKKTIAVIDDDPDILDALDFMLADAGYCVVTSEKGEFAETMEPLPDVLILDVLLSGKDGRVICKKLKSDQKTRNLPVIMISAHPSAAKSSKEFGADDFVAKPFDIDDLLSKVEKLTH